MSKRKSARSSDPGRSGAARQRVRIVGGHWRGRLIDFPDRPGLRPTADRTRETLFNWLQPMIRGASCLDLFAGSGVLGLEAASRGAAQVHLFESDPVTVENLEQQVIRLTPSANSDSADTTVDSSPVSAISIHSADAVQMLDKGPGQGLPSADIVFVDPPFDAQLQTTVLLALQSRGWLKNGACVYLEAREAKLADLLPTAAPDGTDGRWHIQREKRAGGVTYGLATLECRDNDGHATVGSG